MQTRLEGTQGVTQVSILVAASVDTWDKETEATRKRRATGGLAHVCPVFPAHSGPSTRACPVNGRRTGEAVAEGSRQQQPRTPPSVGQPWRQAHGILVTCETATITSLSQRTQNEVTPEMAGLRGPLTTVAKARSRASTSSVSLGCPYRGAECSCEG